MLWQKISEEIGSAAGERFRRYDVPEANHRFSLRYRLRKRRMLREFQRARADTAVSVNTASRPILHKRGLRGVCYTLAIAFTAAMIMLVTGSTDEVVSESFWLKRYSDNTRLMTVNTEGSPEVIEELYYPQGFPSEYRLIQSDVFEHISAFYMYENVDGDTATFTQYVKSCFDTHFDNEHDNPLEFMMINAREAYYWHRDEYGILVWDQGDYILEAGGRFTKDELAELVLSAKIH